MIKTYSNTLDDILIKNIIYYLKDILGKNVWASSNGWDKNIVSNSSTILSHTIENKYLYQQIKNSIEDKIKLKFDEINLEFSCSMYLWGAGSYLTWHNDAFYPYNGTIYLNKNWDSNDGGIFLYKDNITKQIIGIEPQYNLMVVNSENKVDKHNLHSVTYILPNAIEKRITIQWRTNKVIKNNKNKILYK